MGAANNLSAAEVGLIKAMLGLRPRPSNQTILSYFTKPLRDINHRVIAEIDGGWRWPGEPAASAAQALTYMAAMENVIRPDPDSFLGVSMGRLVLDWWPVGQGLFSSGTIIRHQASPLTWVYDCGTTSSDAILCDALNSYGHKQRGIGASKIRLAVLSHFDRDHIGGFIRLVERFPIRTLLLPYIPMWQRLVIAIELSISADDPIFGFFLDPVTFLLAIDGGEIGEIVFVPSTGPDDPVPSLPEGPDLGPEDIGGDTLKIEYDQPPPEAAGDPATLSCPQTRVRFLKKAGRIMAPLVWEFVPYNDAEMAPKATPAFLTAAAPLIETLRNDSSQRGLALTNLKALYEQNFGSSSVARNLISLFLYSGPLGHGIGLYHFFASHAVNFNGAIDRFSQMYTGDGALNTWTRYEAFRRFFSPAARLARSAIFQVMHHGARGSWHAGVATALAPAVSLFSSDPAHRGFGHPHCEVLRDFWPYCATQIDREQGFHFVGSLDRR